MMNDSNAILSQSLCLDLETTPDGKIFKIGAAYQEQIFEKQGKFDLQAALSELDKFGVEASYVLGHNLLGPGSGLSDHRSGAQGHGTLSATTNPQQ